MYKDTKTGDEVCNWSRDVLLSQIGHEVCEATEQRQRKDDGCIK